MFCLKTYLLFFVLLLSQSIHAEYRVFLLEISSPSNATDQSPAISLSSENTKTDPATENNSKPQKSVRYVTSTLDPLQYKYYYPLQAGETISYTQTWMCRGHTGNSIPYCSNPKTKVEPTSATH